MTDYEEVWRELPVPPGAQIAWILQSVDRKETTFLGRVSGYFLAFQQAEGGPFSARREDLNGGDKWSLKYSIGDATMPSAEDCLEAAKGRETKWSTGHVIDIAGDQYRVLAIETFEAAQ